MSGISGLICHSKLKTFTMEYKGWFAIVNKSKTFTIEYKGWFSTVSKKWR